jgi:PAS domain S-box-containing protein
MIVEDEPIVAMDIKRCLIGLGYKVTAIAADSEEAVRKIEEGRPDLVLMDIHIKGKVDGVETAWRVRQRFNVPIVYLTSFSDADTLERAKFTEPYGYILKPYEDRDLHTTIEMALHRFQKVNEMINHHRSLSTILRSIGDAVLAADCNGNVTYMNAVAEVITGVRQPDAVSRKLSDILPFDNEQQRVDANRVIEMVLRDETIGTLGKHNFLGRANNVQEDTTVRPLRGSNGDVTGAVVIIQCREPISDPDIDLPPANEPIQFTRYVQNLLSNLLISYGIHSGSLAVNLDISDHIRLEIETAYSCGLIINELVAISLKNAFADDQAGEITISFLPDQSAYELVVSDDGQPYGTEWKSSNIESFGMRVVYSIAEQLGGTVERPSSSRNEHRIRFPQA